jgi:hypothetical protein
LSLQSDEKHLRIDTCLLKSDQACTGSYVRKQKATRIRYKCSQGLALSTKNDEAHTLQSIHMLSPNPQTLTRNQYLLPHPIDMRGRKRESAISAARKQT